MALTTPSDVLPPQSHSPFTCRGSEHSPFLLFLSILQHGPSFEFSSYLLQFSNECWREDFGGGGGIPTLLRGGDTVYFTKSPLEGSHGERLLFSSMLGERNARREAVIISECPIVRQAGVSSRSIVCHQAHSHNRPQQCAGETVNTLITSAKYVHRGVTEKTCFCYHRAILRDFLYAFWLICLYKCATCDLQLSFSMVFMNLQKCLDFFLCWCLYESRLRKRET